MVVIEIARYKTSDGPLSRFIIDVKHVEVFSEKDGKLKALSAIMDAVVDELENTLPDAGPHVEGEHKDGEED